MQEMEECGIADKIRKESGNLRYEYYVPVNDKHTILLIDSWENEEALAFHHASPMMKEISALREKYDLHMRVERYTKVETNEEDEFIRK